MNDHFRIYASILGAFMIAFAMSFGLVMAKDTARLEVRKPVGATRELPRTFRSKDALVKVRKADPMAIKNADERLLGERSCASGAVDACENSNAARTREDDIASGTGSDRDRQNLLRELVVQQFAESLKMGNAGRGTLAMKAGEGGSDVDIWALRIRQVKEATEMEPGIRKAAQMFMCGAFHVCLSEIR